MEGTDGHFDWDIANRLRHLKVRKPRVREAEASWPAAAKIVPYAYV
jgi:hypothetical protein